MARLGHLLFLSASMGLQASEQGCGELGEQIVVAVAGSTKRASDASAPGPKGFQLSEDDRNEFYDLMFGFKQPQRAKMNGIESGTHLSEREEYLGKNSLDLSHVFEEIIVPEFEERQLRRDGYPRNYLRESPLVSREVATPLVDAAEVRERQGIVGELIRDQNTWEALGRWVSRRGRYLSGDARDDSITNFYSDAFSDADEHLRGKQKLELVEATRENRLTAEQLYGMSEDTVLKLHRTSDQELSYLKQSVSSARYRLMSRVKHFYELPALLEELAAISTSPQSRRMAQVTAEARVLSQIGKITKFQEQLTEAGFDTNKDSNLYTDAELKKFGEILAGAASDGKDSWLANITYVGNEAVRSFYLSNIAREHGWTYFPDVRDRQGNKPFFEIRGAHNPRVLREKGISESDAKKAGIDLSRRVDSEDLDDKLGRTRIVPDDQASNLDLSVGNDIAVGGENPNGLIVTGENARGKSTTIIRTPQQLMILAQMGLPVPAEYMAFTPLNLYQHRNPGDAAEKGQSQFVKQAADLERYVSARMRENSFQLIALDEVLPGSTSEIRTAAEKAFLEDLIDTGALIVVSTHNWNNGPDGQIVGTPTIADRNPQGFRNVHIDKDFRLQDGAQTDKLTMILGGARALHKAGWTNDKIRKYLEEAGIDPSKIQNVLDELK